MRRPAARSSAIAKSGSTEQLAEGADFPRLQASLSQPPHTDRQFDIAGHDVERLVAQDRIDLARGIALNEGGDGWHDDAHAIVEGSGEPLATWGPQLKENGPQALADIVMPETFDGRTLTLES
jgi:hypothetical protein